MPLDYIPELKGIKFPFALASDSGGARGATDAEQIESCLKMLLVTEKGSRVMMRDYGLGLGLILQEPNDEMAQNLFKRLIFEEIMRWEPRVILNSVQFSVEEETLHIYLEYQVGQRENIMSDFAFPIA